jgi:hypothetical protein
MICESASIYMGGLLTNILYRGGYHLLRLGVHSVDFVSDLVYNIIK